MTAEHSPLLPAGFHDITIKDLEGIFIQPFTSPKHRENLVAKFKLLVAELQSFNIPFEIWLDGSFTTKNPKPKDIDIVVFANQSKITNLPIKEQEKLWVLFHLEQGRIKGMYNCDAYLEFTEDAAQRSYWRGWFGFSKSEKPKGIARVFI